MSISLSVSAAIVFFIAYLLLRLMGELPAMNQDLARLLRIIIIIVAIILIAISPRL